MTSDIIKYSLASYLALLKSGDYDYISTLLTFTILILFIGLVIYLINKS